jgi:hypothetical protein
MKLSMVVFVVLGLTATQVSEIESKCENPSNFPVLEGDKYLCSVVYQVMRHFEKKSLEVSQ